MIMQKEIIKAVEEDDLYDFVFNEYYRMNKNDLVDLLKELTYAIYRGTRKHAMIQEEIRENLTEQLHELWDEEIAEEEEFEERWED